MTIRNMLLHIDATKGCRHRVAAAFDLAARLDARVVGLATTGTLALPAGFGMAPSGELLAAAQDYLESQARLAVERFEEAARLAGSVAFESRIAEGDESTAVALSARYTDLVVVGQKDPEADAEDGARVAPGEVLMRSPRPVLVVPYIAVPAGFGSNVLVAWNGSREASRAVGDALPLLQRAGRVTVMVVNPDRDEGVHGDLPGADLAAYLAHHGVKIDVQADTTPVNDVGEELLSRVADLGADLLVMGGYGHSRTREWVFGGATRTILTSMTVPVLMAH